MCIGKLGLLWNYSSALTQGFFLASGVKKWSYVSHPFGLRLRHELRLFDPVTLVKVRGNSAHGNRERLVPGCVFLKPVCDGAGRF